MTFHPGLTGICQITGAIKSSTVQRDYKIREWPGNTDMRKSLLMDPFVAMLSWMCTRENTDEYLFSDVNEKGTMRYDTPWSNSDFTTFFRLRLPMCGVGKDDVIMYTGNCIKRGCV